MNKVEIEWIPTEERLPKEEGTYLICINMKKIENEWVPTKERLPEEGGTYLGPLKTRIDIFEWSLPFRYDNGNIYDGYWNPLTDEFGMVPPLYVKAWAYLPEPYKEDTKDNDELQSILDDIAVNATDALNKYYAEINTFDEMCDLLGIDPKCATY